MLIFPRFCSQISVIFFGYFRRNYGFHWFACFDEWINCLPLRAIFIQVWRVLRILKKFNDYIYGAKIFSFFKTGLRFWKSPWFFSFLVAPFCRFGSILRWTRAANAGQAVLQVVPWIWTRMYSLNFLRNGNRRSMCRTLNRFPTNKSLFLRLVLLFLFFFLCFLSHFEQTKRAVVILHKIFDHIWSSDTDLSNNALSYWSEKSFITIFQLNAVCRRYLSHSCRARSIEKMNIDFHNWNYN